MSGPLRIHDGYLFTNNEPPEWYRLFMAWHELSRPPSMDEVRAAYLAWRSSPWARGSEQERAFYAAQEEQFLLWCRLSLRFAQSEHRTGNFLLLGVGKHSTRAAVWARSPHNWHFRCHAHLPKRYGWFFLRTASPWRGWDEARTKIQAAVRPRQRVRCEPFPPVLTAAEEALIKTVGQTHRGAYSARVTPHRWVIDGYPLPGEATFDAIARQVVYGPEW